jgi:hypothetical protein
VPSRLQASRAAQAELIRLGIENPAIVSAVLGRGDPDDYIRAVYMNWFVKSIELSYSLKAISAESVRVQASRLFEASYPRAWWNDTREVYRAEAMTRRERDFFVIVESSFHDTIRRLTSSGNAP